MVRVYMSAVLFALSLGCEGALMDGEEGAAGADAGVADMARDMELPDVMPDAMPDAPPDVRDMGSADGGSSDMEAPAECAAGFVREEDGRCVSEGSVNLDPSRCTLPPHPLIQPRGFQRHVLAWEDLFQNGPFPGSVGYLNPVGSFSVGRMIPGVPAAGMYLSVPVVPEASSIYVLSVGTAQAVSAAGYNGGQHRAGGLFVSISPCAGDVRALDVSSRDDLLRVCRSDMLYEGTFRFTTRAGASSTVCKLEAGRTYWLNFMMSDPSLLLDAAGLPDATLNSCDQGEHCEGMVQVSTLRAD